MRSRYSACALGGYGDYLLETWFPATAKGLDAISLSRKTREFSSLEILDRVKRGDRAEVEFRAGFTDAQGGSQLHHERSEFVRLAGRWYYVGAIL